jgi:hypothetical protein
MVWRARIISAISGDDRCEESFGRRRSSAPVASPRPASVVVTAYVYL